MMLSRSAHGEGRAPDGDLPEAADGVHADVVPVALGGRPAASGLDDRGIAQPGIEQHLRSRRSQTGEEDGMAGHAGHFPVRIGDYGEGAAEDVNLVRLGAGRKLGPIHPASEVP